MRVLSCKECDAHIWAHTPHATPQYLVCYVKGFSWCLFSGSPTLKSPTVRSPFELSSTHIPNLLIPINMKFTEKDWLPHQDHLLKITRQQQSKASDTWFFSILCPLLVPRSPPWGSSCVGSSVCCSSFLSICLYGCNGISGSVIPLPVASDDHHVCFSAFLCLSVDCRVL